MKTIYISNLFFSNINKIANVSGMLFETLRTLDMFKIKYSPPCASIHSTIYDLYLHFLRLFVGRRKLIYFPF